MTKDDGALHPAWPFWYKAALGPPPPPAGTGCAATSRAPLSLSRFRSRSLSRLAGGRAATRGRRRSSRRCRPYPPPSTFRRHPPVPRGRPPGKRERFLPCPKRLRRLPHSKQVGNYLVKLINKGSFPKVIKRLHITAGEKVAIEVLDNRKAKQDSYILKITKHEPWICQMIKHPEVFWLYETLETDNSYYMVMELCFSGVFLDRICYKKRLAESEVRSYTRQILSGVQQYLHYHGIVHRDLKIASFLLDENNNIKVVGFGLNNTAKFEGLSQELLHTQRGSPAYAAPELLARRKYGPKVDVWYIDVSMFVMLTSTLPFMVEPFNIKQLHPKMLIAEISPIPSDISPGKAL
ncbi:LOW QUALITY PROTEIN: hormonally up-regulated neu tumor-associated kinase-like [Ara ararauna]